MARVVGFFHKELTNYGTTDFSELSNFGDPIGTLRTDIARAEKGEINWQNILISTKPLVERY